MTSGKETVVVAMSGGVDSSVAAGLLQDRGYNVIGVTLIFRPCEDDGVVNWCCGVGAREQAGSVCGRLGVRHYAYDCAVEFEAEVLRPAWDEYEQGRTPSPCLACNGKLKFGLLLNLAKKLGADKIATGHYSRIVKDEQTGELQLLRADDPLKDQSYFLFPLNKVQLEHTLFPLGNMTKPEVRELAREMGFANAQRKESQDACFSYSQGTFADGLQARFNGKIKSGNIVDPKGNILGSHKGIHNFTIGQRKGLGIALGKKAYVTHIDPKTHNVVLSSELDDVKGNILTASKISWTGDMEPNYPFKCQAQIRSQHKAAPATVEFIEPLRIKVQFETPQSAIAPGQAVVLFDGDRVLGGGWID